MAIATLENWAKSRAGKAIPLMHSAGLKFQSQDRPVILIGGVHGDEPEGVRLAEESLQWLIANANSVKVPWIVIPCINPDGFAAGTRTNSAGVDLNRNYPARSWSREFTEPRYNPGPTPGSEPEIQALVKLLNQVQPRLTIHCHSWNPCIVMTGEPARTDAARLAECSGYPLQETIGYDTPGSLSQYGWQDNKLPIICIEEQEGTPLDKVWAHFKKGISEIFYDASSRMGNA